MGTSKAAAAAGLSYPGPSNTDVDRRRRRLVWVGVTAFLTAWFLAFFRFFLPRTLFEPNTVFKIGYPSEFSLGVDTKFQQKYRIWVDRTPDRLFVIYARCTHLGCTPDWKPAENKFKCPCHGSGYDSEGINFEGPAPRPMDRAKLELAPDGQIIVDTSRLYQWPKGQPSHFNDPGAFLPACKQYRRRSFDFVRAGSAAFGRTVIQEAIMADENNGKNGKVGLVDRVKEDIQAMKVDIPTKAKEQIEGLKDPTKTQVYTSIFRHKHDDTPRNRALGVLSNVFLHLHPAKINRDSVRYSYTWGMGGITFFLFIILTYTGVLLMFYYHPSKVQAFRDVLYLEHDVPFGKILRNMHRWAAHLMVIAVELHMFRVFLTGSYKKPREFNWNIGVLLLVFTLLLSFTGYLLPDDQLGFWAVTVGTNMARATPLLGHEGPFGSMLGMTPYNDVRFGLLGGSIVDANALLRSYIWHCIGIPIVASILMIVHFWRVRKDGGISGPAPVMLEAEADKPRRGPKAAGE